MSSSTRTRRSDTPSLDGVSALVERIWELSPLEIEDIKAKRRSQTNHSANKRPISDADLALALFAEEAEALLNVRKDRSRDGRNSEEVLEELFQMEEIARYDHALAVALSEGRDPPPRPPNLRRRKRRPADGADDGDGAPASDRNGHGHAGRRAPRAGKGKGVQRYHDEPEAISEGTEEEWSHSGLESMTSQRMQGPSPPSNGNPTGPLTQTAGKATRTTILRGAESEGSLNEGHETARSVTRMDEANSPSAPVPVPTSRSPTRWATAARGKERSHSGASEMPISGAYEEFTLSLARDRPLIGPKAAERPLEPAVTKDPSSAETHIAPVFRSTLGRQLSQRPVSDNAWPTTQAASSAPQALVFQASSPVSQAPSTPTSAMSKPSRQPSMSSSPAPWSAPVAQSKRLPRLDTESVPSAMQSRPIIVNDSLVYVTTPRPAPPSAHYSHASSDSPEDLHETTRCLSVRDDSEFTERAPSPPSSVEAILDEPGAVEDVGAPIQRLSHLWTSTAMHAKGLERVIYSPRVYAATSVGHSMPMPEQRRFVSGEFPAREVAQDDEALAPMEMEAAQELSPVSDASSELDDVASSQPGIYEVMSSPQERASPAFSPMSRHATPPTPDPDEDHFFYEASGPPSREHSPALFIESASPSYPSTSEVPMFPQTVPRPVLLMPEPSSGESSSALYSLSGPLIRAAPASPQIAAPRSASPALFLYERVPEPEMCVMCRSEINDSDMVVRITGCGHTIDMACFQDMFIKATVDESCFPPKCCPVAIRLAEVERFLAPVLVDRFRHKEIEFTTPNRVYCCNSYCSAFLGTATLSPKALPCSACASTTCASCKEKAHPRMACRSAGDDALLGLAKERKWQKCARCQYLVERADGCPHMTCRCGAQFCYLCGKEWGKCNGACPR